MKDLFIMLIKRDISGLMLKPTDDVYVQMFRYLFVGGTAFLVDLGALMLFIYLGMNPFIAVAFAFVWGLTVNYILTKLFVFTQKANVTRLAEFIIYAVIGVFGLGITEVIFYIGTEIVYFHIATAKIIAAAVVLIWNFGARKLILYRRNVSQ